MYTINEIIDFVKQYIDSRYRDITEISVKNSNSPDIYFIVIKSKPTPWRSDTSDKTFSKIKLGKKSSYISFNTSYIKAFDKYSVSYSKIKSENMIRINLDDFFKIAPDVLEIIFNYIFINSFNITTFGCCGKFKECEEKGMCVHPDIIYASACQYRKIINKRYSNLEKS